MSKAQILDQRNFSSTPLSQSALTEWSNGEFPLINKKMSTVNESPSMSPPCFPWPAPQTCSPAWTIYGENGEVPLMKTGQCSNGGTGVTQQGSYVRRCVIAT